MNTAPAFRDFQPGDRAAFRRPNEEWISRFFVLEPKDIASFADPQRTILDKGGRIFLALQDGAAIGCCALVARGPGTFEAAKMVVTVSAQGSGIGRKLLAYTIDQARSANAASAYRQRKVALRGGFPRQWSGPRLNRAAHWPPLRGHYRLALLQLRTAFTKFQRISWSCTAQLFRALANAV